MHYEVDLLYNTQLRGYTVTVISITTMLCVYISVRGAVSLVAYVLHWFVSTLRFVPIIGCSLELICSCTFVLYASPVVYLIVL